MIYRIVNEEEFEHFRESHNVNVNKHLSLRKQVKHAIELYGYLPEKLMTFHVCEIPQHNTLRIMNFIVELEVINDQN